MGPNVERESSYLIKVTVRTALANGGEQEISAGETTEDTFKPSTLPNTQEEKEAQASPTTYGK